MIAHNKPSLFPLLWSALFTLITLEIPEIPTLKQNQIYPLYNQDYQNYKKEFNKGTNFRVFSKDKVNDKIHKGFYILKVPEDKNTQEYFRVEL